MKQIINKLAILFLGLVSFVLAQMTTKSRTRDYLWWTSIPRS